jgi:RNA polymerase sigma-70 factor (sigma-E family)
MELAASASTRDEADSAALAAFCGREHPRLVGALTLYTGDRHLAEELAQDAIVRVIVHWPRVAAMDSPSSWAYRVALNLANSSFRRRMAGRRAVARLDAMPTTTAVEANTDMAIALRAAVAALPERQRTALVLRYYADLTPPEVAEIMGCKPGTVWAHVHMAIEALRRTEGLEGIEVHE